MTNLKEGELAPAFEGVDQNGSNSSIRQLSRSQGGVIFLSKRRHTRLYHAGVQLRDNYSELFSKGFQVIGVSTDSVKSHKKFENKYHLPFPLIADEDRKIVGLYNVWGEKNLWGEPLWNVRTTFLIDEEGKIKKIYYKDRPIIIRGIHLRLKLNLVLEWNIIEVI